MNYVVTPKLLKALKFQSVNLNFNSIKQIQMQYYGAY